MSEAPKRAWLDVEFDDSGKDFGVSAWRDYPEAADETPDVSLWISAAVLRELCEKWEARAKTDYSLTHSPSCFASELLAVLEGKD